MFELQLRDHRTANRAQCTLQCSNLASLGARKPFDIR
jgi:hypothetical protein